MTIEEEIQQAFKDLWSNHNRNPKVILINQKTIDKLIVESGGMLTKRRLIISHYKNVLIRRCEELAVNEVEVY